MRPLVPLLVVFCLTFLPAAVKCAPTEDDDESAVVVLPDLTQNSVETPPLPDDVEQVLLDAMVAKMDEMEPADRKKREPRSAEDVCEDAWPDKCKCRYWAMQGHCRAAGYELFMIPYCEKSCANCTSTEEEVCDDYLSESVCGNIMQHPSLAQLAHACCQKTADLCPVIEPTEDEIFAQECLDSHNDKRARHQAPPLVWDEMCAQRATQYAKKLKADYDAGKSHPLKHSTQAERTWVVDGRNVVHGENLYWTWSDPPRCTGSSKYVNAVKSWYEEKPLYQYYRRGGRPVTQRGIRAYGHFTQMVWVETGRVGCGRSDNKPNNILCCYYEKGGNVFSTTQFNRNVKV